MGSPKALLPDPSGRSFLDAACALLASAGVSPLFVVVGRHRDQIEPALGGRATLVLNPSPERGQVSSMALGLEAARSAGRAWALVTLVDHPAVSGQSAALLAQAAAREPEAVHVPTFRGVRGHPVALPVSLAAALREAREGEGARDVIARSGLALREHPLDDAGVLVDVDTPEDLRRYREEES